MHPPRGVSAAPGRPGDFKTLDGTDGREIWVTSEADYRFGFPARDSLPAALPAKAPTSLHDWSAKRVLVVDDNETNRVAIVTCLSAWKIAAQSVGGPKEALEAIRAGRWDAVLIDSHMPEMDGAQLAMVVNREFVSDTPPMVLLRPLSGGGKARPRNE